MASFQGFVPANTRIAIIGAGAAGLCAANIFAATGYKVTVYEAARTLGGTWVYSPTDSITSALYESLRCNIPKQAMAFSDHPFSSDVRSFPSHREVLRYIQSYSDKFQLSQFCRFGQAVKTLNKDYLDGTVMWNLTTTEGLEDAFDAVIVCNGHYSTPHFIQIPGEDEFIGSQRNILHSHKYKTPTRFANRRVVVIGSGPSGVDISVEVSKHASTVFISHRKIKGSIFHDGPGRIPEEVAPVSHVTGSGEVHLKDGLILRDIDDIVLCTGYEYTFPFLNEDTAGVSISSDGRSVHGLLRHCVAAKDPTLAFIGIPWAIIPFPLFEDQVHFLAALYDVNADRKKFAELLEEEKAECQAAKSKGEYYHRFGDAQWEYRRKLCDFAGRVSVEASMVEVVRDATTARTHDPVRYREREYHVLGAGRDQWRVNEGGFDVSRRDDAGSPTSS